MQVEEEEIKEEQYQRQEPLAFLEVEFSKSQKNCTMYEKEAFALKKVLKSWITSYGDLT